LYKGTASAVPQREQKSLPALARAWFPQGLKHGFLWLLSGTTEVVPCYKAVESNGEVRSFSAACEVVP
jgi:hypothetical protein